MAEADISNFTSSSPRKQALIIHFPFFWLTYKTDFPLYQLLVFSEEMARLHVGSYPRD